VLTGPRTRHLVVFLDVFLALVIIAWRHVAVTTRTGGTQTLTRPELYR
jgi:hypothetical protein